LELEAGREVPAGEMHVRARVGNGTRDRRQRRRAVDEHLDLVSLTRRRLAGRPHARRRLERVRPADPLEAAVVVRANRLLDALAARVEPSGAAFLDAPVSGSPATLAAGQMSVLVGGDNEAFERIRPVLEAVGPKVTYLGGNGSALVVKLAINVSLVVQGMS